MAFWLMKARTATAAYLHAAALTGRDIDAVWAWANRKGDQAVMAASMVPGASPELLTAADELRRDGKSSDSIRMTMCQSLSWIAIPALRHSVSGPGMAAFDAAEWAFSRSTVYMITDENSEAAPLYRAVTEKIYRDAVMAGTLTRYGRLPNPPLFALDELTQTVAAPVGEWISTAAGSGIQLVYVVHTPADRRDKYGDAQAAAIWAKTGTKVILGGNTDPELAQDISALCGHYGDEKSEMVCPPAYIRQLPEVRALIIAGNRAPLSVKTRPLWHRTSYRLGTMPKLRVAVPGLVPAVPELVTEVPEQIPA